MNSVDDEMFMMECLTLAMKGCGSVSPNPLVGAVLVKNGKVIGRGYHKVFGGPHAEVEAVRSATISSRGATLYVNLEPCNHIGKTPPCTEFIISSGIRRVVIGMRDPNPLVRGGGVRVLRRAGIKVEEGLLREECEKLNEFFVKYITKKIPFVSLKVAQTLNGKITDDRQSGRRWITNLLSRTVVHQLRARYDAVLVGAGTIMADNPSLNVRHVKGRDPVRVILDGRLKSAPSARVFQASKTGRTLLFTSRRFAERNTQAVRAFQLRGVDVVCMPSGTSGRISLSALLTELGSMGIASLLVEGGAEVYNEFLSKGVLDKLYLFIAPRISRNGLDGLSTNRASSFRRISQWNLGGDVLIEAYPE